MAQTNTHVITFAAILRSTDFKDGVADVRAGRPARFDDYSGWLYEWGRQFAYTVPAKRKPSFWDLSRAFDRGDLADGGIQ